MSDFYRLVESAKACGGHITPVFTRHVVELVHPDLGALVLFLFEFRDEIYRLYVYRGGKRSRRERLPLTAALTEDLIRLCQAKKNEQTGD